VTTLSTPSHDDTHYTLASWAFSLCFHGLAIGAAVTLMTNLHLPPQTEPFKWEVSMVEPQPSPQAAPPAPAQPVESRPVEPQPVEPQPVVQKTIQTVQTVQRVVHQEVRTATPVAQTSPRPVPQAAEVVTRTTQALETPSTAAPDQTTAAVAPVQATTETNTVKSLPVRTTAAPRRDYGWLAESLWSKVEQMKRYPAMARMNRWEGKVVLKAVIKKDGSIVDLAIVESSGHAVLDNEALEVVERASPLTLKHDLGQPQVTVQIPISYALR